MKINKELGGTGIFLILFYFFCKNIDVVIGIARKISVALLPFLWAGLIVLILHPVIGRLNKKIKNEKLCSAICMIAFLVLLILLVVVIAPQLIVSITRLIDILKNYDYNFFITYAINKFHLPQEAVSTIENSFGDISSMIIMALQDAIPALMNLTVSIINNIFNFVTGVIIAWYILSEKDLLKQQIKKIINKYRLLKDNSKVFYLWKVAIEKFNGFLSGKIIDSIIVGIICYVFLLITNVEYAGLISLIIGVTNIIPFFGPFIGAIPSSMIILIIAPSKTLMFIIFIIILQQIDGNIIGPKILGDSVGVSKIGIIFAILVGGKLFGFV